MNNYNYIQVNTEDGFKLNGLYKEGDKNKVATILIHGFTSDFYSHKFYHSIAEKLESQSNAIILAQTRGTGIQTEFIKTNGDAEYLGSYFEKIEDAHFDISAYVEYLLNNGYTKIVLAGHSLGTIKSVRYLFEGKYKDKITKLVLLAPFDKNAFMEVKAPNKWHDFVEIAKEKIDQGKGREIVPIPEWEDFSMSYITFYSWYKQDDLSCMWDFFRKDYDFPILQKINIPVKIIVGDNDDFFVYKQLGTSYEDAVNVLNKFIKNSEFVLINGAVHTYINHDEEVANEVVKFIN